MKKSPVVLLTLGAVLSITGALFKTLHYPYSDVLLAVALTCTGVAIIQIIINSRKTNA